MNRFFIYEEYGAKYELMIKDVSMAYRTMPGWPSYQKGLEVLAASMGSANSNKSHARKSLSIADLLVKVISFSTRARSSKLTRIADTTCVQVSSSVLRVAQEHTRGRLPIFAHGDREHAYQASRSHW